MESQIFSPVIQNVIKEALIAASKPSTKTILVDGVEKTVRYPFPSSSDWRDQWIYFVMTDRFNKEGAEPVKPWDEVCYGRQGGTFKGIQQQLGYLSSLGVGAIWLTPVLKNWHPDNYHGYGIQNFLAIEGSFASDGTSLTAERELKELIEEAHARNIYVIFDVVLNHAGRIFDYAGAEEATPRLTKEILYGALGQELPIRWRAAYSTPAQYLEGSLPAQGEVSFDDAVWPNDLQRDDFFRRLGSVVDDHYPEKAADYPFGRPAPNYFVKGDFDVNRQLVAEYEAKSQDLRELRDKYGVLPVLSILVQIHQYLIAKFDVDGFRIDTVKFIRPDVIEQFGNAIREFALSIGKKNFFTFGEIWDNEATIAAFTGRNSASEGYGIDAAVDYPLFNSLTKAAKGLEGGDVENIRHVFKARKEQEENLLSSHGEASRFFVTFLDNHDQKERFGHPYAYQEQITLGIASLFCLQGIPCLYYGTEQGLVGTRKDLPGDRIPDLGNAPESVREALWGKDNAFDTRHPLYTLIQDLSELRRNEPALRYGRQYFREVSHDGDGFGQSAGRGGILAFARILNNREVVLIANTNPDPQAAFSGFVLLDHDLNPAGTRRRLSFSNQPLELNSMVEVIKRDVVFYNEGNEVTGRGPATVLPISLRPMEVQIFTPEWQISAPVALYRRESTESIMQPRKEAVQESVLSGSDHE